MTDLAALKKAHNRLKRVEVIPAAAQLLGKSAAKAERALRTAVVSEVPALADSRDPDMAAVRDQHATDHLNEILRLFAGGEVGDFAFVGRHAQLRAEQYFPLEAILNAYRCGQKVFLQWMQSAANSPQIHKSAETIVDFVTAYTDAISDLMTAGYVAHVRRLAEAEGDRRTGMLNTLLSGGEVAYGQYAAQLKRDGYLEPRQCFCVAVAQSTDPLEMRNAPRAERIVEAITTCADSANIRVLAGVRNEMVVAVFAATQRQSGWTPKRVDLATSMQAVLLALGPAVLIGLGREKTSLALLPKSLQEATIALSGANVGDRVVRFDNLSLRRLLLHGNTEYLRSAAPSWLPALAAANNKANGALFQTLRTYADADMNLINAARTLAVHPNTLYARMKRITALTGLNCQHFHELTELLLAADCS